jgi:hypothetical protein
MGDRCWIEITITIEDAYTLYSIVNNEVLSDPPPDIDTLFHTVNHVPNTRAIDLTEDQANYGWYDQLRELARRDIPFFGSHSAGGEYSASVFASYNEEIDWIEIPGMDGRPVIEIFPGGYVSQSELERVLMYFDRYESAHQFILGTGSLYTGMRIPNEDINHKIVRVVDCSEPIKVPKRSHRMIRL